MDKWRGDHKLLGIVIAAAICASLIIKNLTAARAKHKAESIHDLAGCLHTLLALLDEDRDKNKADPCLRLTLYVPTEDGKELEQAMPYIGHIRSGDSTGRRFPSNAGIIGRSYTKRENVKAERAAEDYADFVTELRDNWHFDEGTARRIAAGPSVAWMALVLESLSTGKVAGVVFIDSTARGFFTEERTQRAIYACAGISRFVQHRYK